MNNTPALRAAIESHNTRANTDRIHEVPGAGSRDAMHHSKQ